MVFLGCKNIICSALQIGYYSKKLLIYIVNDGFFDMNCCCLLLQGSVTCAKKFSLDTKMCTLRFSGITTKRFFFSVAGLMPCHNIISEGVVGF